MPPLSLISVLVHNVDHVQQSRKVCSCSPESRVLVCPQAKSTTTAIDSYVKMYGKSKKSVLK